jgi:ankyrin repeat protein
MGGTDPPPASVADFRKCVDGTAAGQYIEDHTSVLDLRDDDDGFTPLHVVAEKGWTELVETVLHGKPDLLNDVSKDKEQTPLHVAILNKKYEVALQLLTRPNVDVNLVNSEGQTPLHLAARFGNLAVVDALVQREDLDLAVMNNQTAANTPYGYASIQFGDDEDDENEIIKRRLLDKAFDAFLLCKSKQDAENYLRRYRDIVNSDNFFLHKAVGNTTNTFLVEAMLDMGADVNATYEHYKITPLHIAVSKGDQNIVEALLEKGANVEAKDKDGYNPLHIAVTKQNQKIVEALLEKGANVEVKDNYDQTPLHIAILKENKNIVEALLKHDADVEAQNKFGLTPLHQALMYRNGNPVIVEALLEKGANVEAKNINGHTPLYVATISEYEETVKVLLKYNADVNAKSDLGLTPLYMAARNGCEEIVKVLLKYNADISAIPTDEWASLSPKIKELLTPPSCAVCNTSA